MKQVPKEILEQAHILIVSAKAHPNGPRDFLALMRQRFYRTLNQKYPDPVNAKRLQLSDRFESVFGIVAQELNLIDDNFRSNPAETWKPGHVGLGALLAFIVVGTLILLWQSGHLGLTNKNLIYALSENSDLKASKDNRFIRGPGTKPFVATSNRPNASSGGTTQGVFIVLGSEIEAAASDNKIRMTITARKAKENGSPHFAVAYSTAAVGNSRWRKFELTEEYSDYSFEYTVPAMKGSPAEDFIGIWADVEGKGRSVVIEDISLSIVLPRNNKS